MEEIRRDYSETPNFRVPGIIFLDRFEGLSSERNLLEQVIQSVPDAVAKDWTSRLLSQEHGMHMGVWFQIMLMPWLQQIGQTVAEPIINGANPDFLVTVGSQELVIEAKVFLQSEEQREQDAVDYDILRILQSINRPYRIEIDELHWAGAVAEDNLRQRVISWLDNQDWELFRYRDEDGNRLEMIAHFSPTMKKLGVMGPARTFYANPDRLKRPLSTKGNQHKTIRRAGYPYVVAILLEDRTLSAEEVVEAWFGKQQAIYDVAKDAIVDERNDLSGIHFFGREIRHTSVSGTLVFRASLNEVLQRHELRSWYIQNPYAKTPIDPSLFPVEGRFVVKDKTPSGYSMSWDYSLENPF